MKIYRIYLDEKKINEVSIELAIDKLEGNEWYKNGTVKDLLKNGNVLQNPYCMYANSKQLLNRYTS